MPAVVPAFDRRRSRAMPSAVNTPDGPLIRRIWRAVPASRPGRATSQRAPARLAAPRWSSNCARGDSPCRPKGRGRPSGRDRLRNRDRNSIKR